MVNLMGSKKKKKKNMKFANAGPETIKWNFFALFFTILPSCAPTLRVPEPPVRKLWGAGIIEQLVWGLVKKSLYFPSYRFGTYSLGEGRTHSIKPWSEFKFLLRLQIFKSLSYDCDHKSLLLLKNKEKVIGSV